uniref:Cysteine-rich protein 2 n=1 Tax=Tetraodon nigroviridis TaxID=99883 RepID=H3C190_TETNG
PGWPPGANSNTSSQLLKWVKSTILVLTGVVCVCVCVCVCVLSAEKVTSLGKDWHRPCLRCAKCNKTLSSGSHAEHEGKPYCHKPCYAALFGPGGALTLTLTASDSDVACRGQSTPVCFLLQATGTEAPRVISIRTDWPPSPRVSLLRQQGRTRTVAWQPHIPVNILCILMVM